MVVKHACHNPGYRSLRTSEGDQIMDQGLMFQIVARFGATAVVLVLFGLVLIAASVGARHSLRRLCTRTEGAAAVEFSLCLLPLLLIVGGIIDFGHCWYMESVVATASREGARYATRYTVNPSNPTQRLAPNALSPSVTSYVTTNYGGLFNSDENFAVTPGGTGYTSTTAGLPVSIQISAQKNWFLLSFLIPGLTNPQPLTSTTVMSLE